MPRADLIDITIEESLSKETLMEIDRSNVYDDFVTTFVFILVGILSILVGFFTPPEEINEMLEMDYKKQHEEVSFRLQNISNWNHFLKIQVAFKVEKWTERRSLENITFSITTTFYTNGKQINKQTQKYKQNLIAPPDSPTTAPIPIYFDHFPNYDEVRVSLDLIQGDQRINGCAVIWTFGNAHNPKFQMMCRIIFSSINILALFFLITKLCRIRYRQWHPEQKLTVGLVILCIIANNPFYIMQVLNPAEKYTIADIAVLTCFYAYARFFVLSIFELYAYKNRRSCLFATAKFIVLIADATTAFASQVVKSNEVRPSDTLRALEPFSTPVKFLFLALLWVAVGRAFVSADSIDRPKLKMYALLSLATAGGVAAFQYAARFVPYVKRETSMVFLATFALQNMYAVAMAMLHWPSELTVDGDYNSGVEDLDELDFGAIADSESDSESVPNSVPNPEQENVSV